MADPCKVEGCVQRTDRLERSLCVQKEEYEERLRVQKEECEERLRQQKEEYEERLRVQMEECEERLRQQKDEHEVRLRWQKEEFEKHLRLREEEERLRVQEEDSTTHSEERLRAQTEMITTRCEERLRVQKDEYEERLRVQKEEYERALLAQQDATVNYYGYYPLPLDHFPLEIIALIADFVHDFDDLANMALVSRRVHNGVLLSRQWIVVEAIVAATDGNVADQKRFLHNRGECAFYAGRKGLVRCLRAMNLSRDEVTSCGCCLVSYGACQYGQLDVLKYLHTTYALTAREFSTDHAAPMALAAEHLPVLKYLHSVMGFTVPLCFPLYDAARCLETLKFCRTRSDADFAANRDRGGDYRALYTAAHSTPGLANCSGVSCGDCGACARERLVYLRDEYGITKWDACMAIQYARGPGEKESIREVFDLEE